MHPIDADIAVDMDVYPYDSIRKERAMQCAKAKHLRRENTEKRWKTPQKQVAKALKQSHGGKMQAMENENFVKMHCQLAKMASDGQLRSEEPVFEDRRSSGGESEVAGDHLFTPLPLQLLHL